MGIKVISPGMLTTVQDMGRRGFMALGFSQSGVMDEIAYKKANALADNIIDEAVLEMTALGGTFLFTESEYIAITGADMNPTIKGKAVPMYTTFLVNEGETLTFGAAKNGMRTYIAFAGGLDVPIIMGSRSTNMKCKIGGFSGRTLKKDDEIEFLRPQGGGMGMRLRKLQPEVYENTDTVRVIMGPQDDYFTENGIDTFLSAEYTVTNESDRMGCKLRGEKIEYKDSVDIISDGISFGSIQVPSGGNPIIMLSDRQTTGGYAKIATVASVDLPLLAQKKAGDTVHFEKISVKKAEKLYKKQIKEIERMLLTSF